MFEEYSEWRHCFCITISERGFIFKVFATRFMSGSLVVADPNAKIDSVYYNSR